jgi:hypothetical protein
VEAENKSDDICEWTVKGKQESEERYAVVARSRKIQTNGGPSNGPASHCRQTRRLALVRAVLHVPRPRWAGCGVSFCTTSFQFISPPSGHFLDTPHVIRGASLHRWRHAQRLVNPTEV